MQDRREHAYRTGIGRNNRRRSHDAQPESVWIEVRGRRDARGKVARHADLTDASDIAGNGKLSLPHTADNFGDRGAINTTRLIGEGKPDEGADASTSAQPEAA